MTVPRFWREIPQRYRLRGAKCATCEARYYPPRAVCPTCRREGVLTPFTLAGKGKLIEWTHIHQVPANFQGEFPLVLGLIQSEDGPVILGALTELEGIELRIGMPVHTEFRRLGSDGASGIIHYGLKWAPNPDEPRRMD